MATPMRRSVKGERSYVGPSTSIRLTIFSMARWSIADCCATCFK